MARDSRLNDGLLVALLLWLCCRKKDAAAELPEAKGGGGKFGGAGASGTVPGKP